MKKLLVNIGVRYNKVATLSDEKFYDLYVDDKSSNNLADNIYLGTVKDVNKKLECVFVDIGLKKNAYLQLDNTDILPNMGEKVILQVQKDETETKGCSCSKNLTLVSRYVILLINKTKKNVPKSNIMFSNDFTKEEISELKKGIKNINIPKDYNFVIRKEAKNTSYEEIKFDMENIIEYYEKMIASISTKDTSKLLHKRNITNIIVTELYDNSVNEIVIDDKETYNELILEMKKYNLNQEIVRLYEDKECKLFELYKIDDEIRKALGKYVWLKHGGELIIEHTEALTVIDVNSAKYEGKKKREDSALLINIDAANEIARQLRIRNISGIVIIDFINMSSEINKAKVYDAFQTAIKYDKQKVTPVGFTKLCLFELTRQKKRKMLKDILK